MSALKAGELPKGELFKYLMDNAIAYKDSLISSLAWGSPPSRWRR